MAFNPNDVGQESLQSKKQEFVRGELWKAAIELFYQSGFDQTTVDQIATHANVSTRTFFRYFSSKEDVMARSMRDYGALLIAALRDQPADAHPIDAAKAVVKQVTAVAVRNERSAMVMHISARSPAARGAQLLELPFIQDDLAAAFKLRGAPGAGHQRFYFALIANLTLSITNLCITTALTADGQHPAQPSGKQIEDIVEEAFVTLAELSMRS